MNKHTSFIGLSFDPAELPSDLWIDGQWRPGATKARIDVLDPSTGKTITSVADASIEDAMAEVTAAHKAGPGWAATAPRQRGEILRRCFELMIARRDMLAELISLENGKSLSDAKGEVTYAAEFFRWFSEEAVRLNGDIYTAPSGANKIVVEHQPIGVSILVTPWNFPAAMATRKIAPALAAVHRGAEAGDGNATDGLCAGQNLCRGRGSRWRRQRPHHVALGGHGQRHAAR